MKCLLLLLLLLRHWLKWHSHSYKLIQGQLRQTFGTHYLLTKIARHMKLPGQRRRTPSQQIRVMYVTRKMPLQPHSAYTDTSSVKHDKHLKIKSYDENQTSFTAWENSKHNISQGLFKACPTSQTHLCPIAPASHTAFNPQCSPAMTHYL